MTARTVGRIGSNGRQYGRTVVRMVRVVLKASNSEWRGKIRIRTVL
jgi:hypothetical protein